MIVKEKTFSRQRCFLELGALGLVLLLFCSGCGDHRGEVAFQPDTQLAWPEPPETARIRYVGAGTCWTFLVLTLMVRSSFCRPLTARCGNWLSSS